MELNKKQIIEYQKNRPPYLMMDCVTEVIPGKSAKGYKYIDQKEWFFACHFPSDPSMPGMLQVEAIVQLTAMALFTLEGNKGKVAYITKLKDASFIKKVLPNSKLELEGEILSFKRGVANCKGVAKVDGKVVCKATFNLVLPHIIEEFKVKE